MAQPLVLEEGWTAPIEETLKTGDGIAQNLTDMTVDLVLQRADGTLVDTAGDVTVVSAPAGQVRYTPDPADLVAAETPHVVRWKVTDNTGAVVYFPSDDPEIWLIRPVAAPTLRANALATLQEIKAAVGIQSNDQDWVLARLINNGSDFLEDQTGRCLRFRAYEDFRTRVTAEAILVKPGWPPAWFAPEWPISSISGLTVNGTAQTVWLPGDSGEPDDADVYVLELTADPKHARDRLFRPAGWCPGDRVTISYGAGYKDETDFPFYIPGAIKEGFEVIARDWYYLATRQAQNVQSRSMQGEAISYINEAIPRQFRALVAAYRRWSL